jgi:molybdenum cofactor guanylyltransferase
VASLSCEIPCYVLAGGKSSRFGSDKARVLIQNIPNLLRLMRELEQQDHSVYVVTDQPDRYLDIGIRSITDSVPDCGPMAGLAASLKHRRQHLGEGWVLLNSCDQVAWKACWFQQLVESFAPKDVAVVFCIDDLQPIPGLYHTLILPFVERAIDDHQLSIKRLLSNMPDKVCAIVSEDNPRSASFNDPEELKALLSKYTVDWAQEKD